jgi:hypothetical protein
MPADGQNEHVLNGDEKQTAGLFKNSLLGWRERYKAQRPEGRAEPVAPKKLKPPRRRKGAARSG